MISKLDIELSIMTPAEAHNKILELLGENIKLKNQLKASMLIAYEDTSDRYYLNVLDDVIPGWSDDAETKHLKLDWSKK